MENTESDVVLLLDEIRKIVPGSTRLSGEKAGQQEQQQSFKEVTAKIKVNAELLAKDIFGLLQ